MSLLLLGESPVAGWGVPDYRQSLAACLAAAMNRTSGRAIDWQAIGRDGITAARARHELLPRATPISGGIVVLVLGVNDSVGLTRPQTWERELRRLILDLRATLEPRLVVLAGVPPIQFFPALPQPLAAALGLRARLLDALAARVATATDCLYVPLSEKSRPEDFCRDGFHPSPVGCTRWAAHVAAAIKPHAPATATAA